jgi:hypothetical protein
MAGVTPTTGIGAGGSLTDRARLNQFVIARLRNHATKERKSAMKFADALIALILVGSVTAVGFAATNFTNTPTEEQVVARIKHDNSAERVKLMAMAQVFAMVCHMQLNQELRDSLRTDALEVLGGPTVDSIEDSARSAAIDLLRQHEAQACVDGYNSVRLRIPDLLTFTFSL